MVKSIREVIEYWHHNIDNRLFADIIEPDSTHIKKYGESGFTFYRRMQEALPAENYPSILDFGCGPLRNDYAKNNNYTSICALDVHMGLVTYILGKKFSGQIVGNIYPCLIHKDTFSIDANLAKTTMFINNTLSARFDDNHVQKSFDGIYSNLVLMHYNPSDVYAIFEEFNRRLYAIGRVAFQLPCYEISGVYNNEKTYTWTQKEIERLANGTGFNANVIHINTGKYHPKNNVGNKHFDLHIFDKR